MSSRLLQSRLGSLFMYFSIHLDLLLFYLYTAPEFQKVVGSWACSSANEYCQNRLKVAREYPVQLPR